MKNPAASGVLLSLALVLVISLKTEYYLYDFQEHERYLTILYIGIISNIIFPFGISFTLAFTVHFFTKKQSLFHAILILCLTLITYLMLSGYSDLARNDILGAYPLDIR